METSNALLIGACVLALLGGGLCCYAASSSALAQLRANQAVKRSGLRIGVLRSGIPGLGGLARMLLTCPPAAHFSARLKAALSAAGKPSEEGALVSVVLALALLLLVVAWAVSGSFVCGCAAVCCLFLGINAKANKMLESQREHLREAIPEALQSMKACFQVGYSLPQALAEVHRSSSGALKELFGEVAGVLKTGGDVQAALRVLKEQGREPELVFLSAALEIQHKTGGSMQQILEAARQSIADEITLKRTMRTQTAQAKLSAQIVTVMPFALIGIFSLVSPGFLSPFFESIAGFAMLGVALFMQLSGIVLVRRILRVEVA